MEAAILQYSQYRRVDCDQKSDRLPDDDQSETNEIMSLVKVSCHLPGPVFERKASDNDASLRARYAPGFPSRRCNGVLGMRE